MSRKSMKSELEELREEIAGLRKTLSGTRRELLAAQAAGQLEKVNTRPVELPTGMQRPPSMEELVQRYVRGALSTWAADQKLGTFEEEDDFEEVDPDTLPNLPFTVVEYPMTDEGLPDASPPERAATAAETDVSAADGAVPDRPEGRASPNEAPTGQDAGTSSTGRT